MRAKTSLGTGLLVSLLSCTPALHNGNCDDDQPDHGVLIETDPAAPLDAVPPVLRVRVRVSGVSLDPSRFVLVEGELGPSQLNQLVRNEPSQALQDRIIPALKYATSHDEVMIAPGQALTGGNTYTIACGEPKLAHRLVVAADDTLPQLAFIWPPESQSATASHGVWCGAEPLPALSQNAFLDPGQLPGKLLRGTGAAGAGMHCVHFSPGDDADGPRVPPPLLFDDVGRPLARLEPRLMVINSDAAPFGPASCQDGTVVFGPSCALVEDDRITVEGHPSPLLWSVRTDATPTAFVVPTNAGDPFVVSPLPTNSQLSLAVSVRDNAGLEQLTTVVAQTAPRMAHVIINEVLANPIGEEPTQEWVELYNDGLETAWLGGYMLSDIGGETVLPNAPLPPGAFALLVNDDFDETSDYDPQPNEKALLLRVPKLGKGGLNNQGEPLKLHDADGIVRSIFPASPKPKAGRSVVRLSPLLPDNHPEAFALCADKPTPGAPNLP